MHCFSVVFMALLAQCLASCHPDKFLRNGFIAEFFHYPLNDNSGWEENFPVDGFKKFGYLGYMDNVEETEFSVSNNVGANEVASGSIYGFPITTTNYSIKLSGYFKASQSGEYKFTLTGSEGAYLKVLSGITCDEDQSGLGTGGFIISPSKPQKGKDVVSESTGSFFLNKEVYYPMELILFNSQHSGSLKASVTFPDGSVLKDLGKAIVDVAFHHSRFPETHREEDHIFGKRERHCVVYEIEDGDEEESGDQDTTGYEGGHEGKDGSKGGHGNKGGNSYESGYESEHGYESGYESEHRYESGYESEHGYESGYESGSEYASGYESGSEYASGSEERAKGEKESREDGATFGLFFHSIGYDAEAERRFQNNPDRLTDGRDMQEVRYCEPKKQHFNGMKAEFFSYKLNTKKAEHQSLRYRDQKKLEEITGVKKSNFVVNNRVSPSKVVQGEIYGVPITTTNFSISLSGWMKAPSTGTYAFTVSANTGATLDLKTETSCYKSYELGRQFRLQVYAASGEAIDLDSNTKTVQYKLQKGYFYRIRLKVFNHQQSGGLRTKVQYPDGTVIDDIASICHSFSFH